MCGALRAGLLALSLLSAGCASRYFYYPNDRIYGFPTNRGIRFETVAFTSADGTVLQGWFMPAAGPAKATVVHFHGNAQNMTAHAGLVDWLAAEGYNVFTFDYRGYGRSQGRPSRRGLYQDCLGAVAYVRTRPEVAGGELVLFGQSLGAAQAIALMGNERLTDVVAVVAESPFYSYRSRVRDSLAAMPGLRYVRWPLSGLIVADFLSPGDVVGEIAPVPLLLIHGAEDEVIDIRHSERLFAEAGEPKQFWRVEECGHLEVFSTQATRYRRQLLAFLDGCL